MRVGIYVDGYNLYYGGRHLAGSEPAHWKWLDVRGLVNPRGGVHAGDLRGHPDDGAGRHWWRRLGLDDFTSHQLPATTGGYTRPPKW
jgi:hypothetical protein